MSGCDSFDFEAPQDEFTFMEGLRGADGTTFYPHVSADGVLSWTNDGEKPNPAPVDISGPPGSSVELRGPVASVEDLPTSAPSGELWLVGTASPYDGWFYNGVQWENAGPVSVGPPGPAGEDGVSPEISVTDITGGHHVTITDATGTKSIDIMDGTDGEQGAPGATPDLQIGTVATGEPGSAAEATITGTPTAPRLNLTLPRGQQGPSVPLSDATPLMDGTASPGTGTSAAHEDHVHPTDTSRASAAELATYPRPNLLDNWYFVGGGSQLGYGIFPINQRGQTTYSGSGYCVDRWGSLSGDPHTVELLPTGMKVTKGAGGSWPLWQLVTSPTSIAGKTVTFSALYKDATNAFTLVLNSYDGSTYASANSDPAVSGGVGLLSVTGTLREADTAVRTVFRLTSGSATIIAAKLEVGSTQTLAHQKNGTWVLNEIPDFSEELYKCCTSHADPSDTYANKSVQYVEDTGWVDLSSYVNTSVFSIRPGFAPAVRIINGVMYYKGELYITTQPSQTAGREVTMLSGIPSSYRPSAQISAAGFTFRELNGYFIFADNTGAITVSAQSYAPTSQYYGFSLSMLSGNLK